MVAYMESFTGPRVPADEASPADLARAAELKTRTRKFARDMARNGVAVAAIASIFAFSAIRIDAGIARSDADQASDTAAAGKRVARPLRTRT